LMAVPIGLEPPERKYLEQKPEPKDAPILSKTLITRMVIMALTMAIITLAVYYLSLNRLGHDAANTLAFTALVVTQWVNALNVRGTYESIFKRMKTRNYLFIGAFIIAVALQFLALFGPLSAFAKTVSVPPLALTVVIIVSFFVPLLVVELHKKLAKK